MDAKTITALVLRGVAYAAQLKFAEGYRTYLAAVGFVGLALYQLFVLGDGTAATSSALMALTAFGLRKATEAAATGEPGPAGPSGPQGPAGIAGAPGTATPSAVDQIAAAITERLTRPATRAAAPGQPWGGILRPEPEVNVEPVRIPGVEPGTPVTEEQWLQHLADRKNA